MDIRGGGGGKMRIRAFPMTMDDKYVEQIWNLLKKAIQQILRKNHSGLSREELYRNAFTMVLHKHGDKLYSGLREVLTEHLRNAVRGEVLGSLAESFLETLNSAWIDYTKAMVMIRDILMYMDRVYVQQENVEPVYHLGLNIFRDEIIRHGSLGERLRTTLLQMIAAERHGEVINRMGVKNACQMLLALGVKSRSVYEEDFENPFLQESAEFFRSESQKFLAENSASVYVKKVEERIAEESERVKLYLDKSTEAKILAVVDEELITKHLRTIVEMEKSGFIHMLENNHIEDLARMYSLCDRVDGGLDVLKAALEKHIEEQVVSAIEKSGSLAHNDPKVYINTILEVRQRYNTLIERLFPNDPSFMDALNKACTAFIKKNYSYFEDEFLHLLIAGKDEDLKQMCLQFKSVGGEVFELLQASLKKYFEKEGTSAIEKSGDTALNDPKEYVNTILEVRRRHSVFVHRLFFNEAGFVKSLDKACTAFINKNYVTIKSNSTFKSPELLARYCDSLLKKSAKNPEGAELDDLLTQAMTVFRYIEDKDVFQKFYCKMLAKRLVGGLSASDDAESSMISKLKQMCGFEYTSKLQRMFTDVGLSKELNEAFKEHQANANIDLNLDFSIMVLGSGAWPLQQTSTFEIPYELVKCIDKFTDFYRHRHNGRKLTWLQTMSKGELTTNCFQKKYTFTVSTAQMALMLMFNESIEYTIGALAENLKLKKEVLVQVVQALVKFQLLELAGGDSDVKSPSSVDKDATKDATADLPDDAIVRLNTSFANKKLKIDLSKTVLRTEVRQEEEQVDKSIEEDRKILIQAAIVRIMKERQRLKHEQLLLEVLPQLASRFQPKVPLIKKCIDMLIEKEYLRRVENEKDLYEYLA